jgi:pimeloyl-ACP methyl ester carboxylesterase
LFVLLHSSGLSHRQWQKFVAGGNAIAPDLTGHGDRPAWPEPKPFSFRDDVAEIAASLTEPVDLVGHSYGGLVALHVAVAVPARVRTLQLYDPVAFGILDPVTDADALTELGAIDLRWSDHERWLTAFVDYWGGAGAWAALRESVREEFRRVAWVVHEGVRSLMLDTTPLASYRALTMPVHLITGEHSPLAAHRVVDTLAAYLPSARRTTIPGAGHMGPLSHADLVNAALRA